MHSSLLIITRINTKYNVSILNISSFFEGVIPYSSFYRLRNCFDFFSVVPLNSFVNLGLPVTSPVISVQWYRKKQKSELLSGEW